MDFFDIVFPLSVPPLTYSSPPDLGKISPGMLVKAEIKKSAHYGIVLGKAARHPDGPVKEILDIVLDKPIMNHSLLSLLKWLAGYYLVPEGSVLKHLFSPEYFTKLKTVRSRKGEKDIASAHMLDRDLPEIAPEILSPVRTSLARNEYKTYLLHTPTFLHEISYALDLLLVMRNCIVLVPETTHIQTLYPLLKEYVGQRLAVLHGKLSKGKRREALQRILTGDADIVLGTRIAVTAPLQSVSLIAVLQEQNRSYKNREGIRYQARDVAVMRGYLEKATVVLSASTPSFESFYNTLKGKYTLLESPEQVRRPRVEVINMKTAKKVTPYLSQRVVQTAASCIKNRGDILFFINRKGYSMIQCTECNTIETCPECAIPLVFHKTTLTLNCHYCTYSAKVTNRCRKCNSTRLEMVGAGTQRIASDIKNFLKREPERYDRDSVREHPHLKGLLHPAQGESIMVGTRAVTGRLAYGGVYALCIFVNPDISLHVPDFRSSENLFQEISSLSEHVKPDGTIMIQTKMSEHPVFRHIKKYRFHDFFREELSLRKSLAYPPFSRMISVALSSKADMSKAIMNCFPPQDEKVEIMGPFHRTTKGIHLWKVILKSTAKERLHQYAREFLDGLKDEKKVKTVTDVEPISMEDISSF
jgi:primosomal protein N' (replication factor Y)